MTPPSADETHPDRPLWVLRKDENEAAALLREISGYGWEARLLFRGDLRQSRMFRDVQDAIDWAEGWRQDLEAKGWTR